MSIDYTKKPAKAETAIPSYFHAKRDPLICPGREEHEFVGWRDFEDGNGGETVCKHCGIGAMAHSLAMDV